MWPVDRPVEKEGVISMRFDEILALLHHQISKVLPVVEHFFSVTPQIVSIGSLPVKEVRVIVDATSHMPKGKIESLTIWHCLGRITKMPFADVSRGVARSFEHFCQSHFFCRHPGASFLRGDIPRNTRARRESSCHQARP